MVVRTLTSVLAIAWAGVAHAQVAPTQTTPPPDAASSTTQAPSALQQEPQPGGETKNTEGQPTNLSATNGDVIVTAQRRSERLVDVPVSVTALSASDLERSGPTSLENVTKSVPGVYIQRQIYGLSPTIRGIGSTLGTSGGEQNVAVYIDGVYQPAPTGNVFDLASVSDVEVLKGPQGTLFGRNATGGALLVKTLDPSFSVAGRFNVSYERFDQVRSSAYVNIPITDTIAINGAVAYRYSPGYIRDNKTGELVNEGHNFTARGKILFQPTSNFSILLAASHADFDDPTGSDYQAITPAPAFLLPSVNSGPIAYDRFHLSHNTQDVVRTSTDEYSAHLKLDLNFGTITSISAYERNFLYSVNDLDSTYATTPAPITLPPPFPPLVVGTIPTNQSDSLEVDTKTFSQELNLTSKGSGPFSYVTGLYYFHNEAAVPFVTSNNVPLFNAYGSGNAYAAYAEATYKWGDLSLIAGARYSHETRFGENAQGVAAPSPFTRFQNATDNKFTPRVGLRYSLSPSSNIYATYSKGFKSGVFDLTTPTGPAVKPETVNAYELGYKTSSRVFTLSAAGFYYDYKDSQVNSTVSGQSGAIFNQLFNVPKSRIYGVDLDATVRFSEAFDLRGAFAWTHARYIDFATAPGYSNAPTASNAFGLIYSSVVINASGDHMVRAPEYTVSATAGYHAKFGNNNRFDLTLSPYYSSRVYFDFANILSQNPYVLLDGAATVTLDNRTKVSIFGRNLTDRTYHTLEAFNALGSGGNYGMPRTYGISLGYSF